ncbi:alcohol dehydrogenase catalytic domain-containing protein [Amycolatopsis mediterranei]|uniref:alcohol dehydrogenase catalytic domain-containing protein n=1 Tax=Amycolatopsis mediterranei TaxID=33910 RepID=UPI001E3D3CA4|nr:alcohol dehydrogenase catalytic domain-containing protein [Amycolatopsis mediterranei]UZF76212.1 alcohol dehydrogenase catalytic domain-containing protein [Amycolatopsis mediterranei]
MVEAGSAVTTVKTGDKVLVSCISACRRCEHRGGQGTGSPRRGEVLRRGPDGATR